MDQNKKTFTEAIQKAKARKDWAQMLLEVQKASQVFPMEESFRAALHEAQAEYVNEKLASQLLVELEKKEDWNSLLKVYEKLLTVFPESKRLMVLLKEVHEKISKAEEKNRQKYFNTAKRQVEDLILKGQLDDAEQACYELLTLNPGEKGVLHLLARAQHLQDKEMDRLLTEYFIKSKPTLKAEYEKHRENFIHV